MMDPFLFMLAVFTGSLMVASVILIAGFVVVACRWAWSEWEAGRL